MAAKSSRASRPKSCWWPAHTTTPSPVSLPPSARRSPTSTCTRMAASLRPSRKANERASRRRGRRRGDKGSSMATNVILPALGIAQDTGKIIEWRKAEGERVTQGEPLVVIETDKAAVDLEAPASGILAQVSAAAGDEGPVAQGIAVILSPEEAARAHSVPAQPVPVAGETPGDGAAAAPAPDSDAQTGSSQETHAPARNGRRAASPKARRIAAEHGVDIMAGRRPGPGGGGLPPHVFPGPAAPAATAAPAPAAPVAPVAVTPPRGGDA